MSAQCPIFSEKCDDVGDDAAGESGNRGGKRGNHAAGHFRNVAFSERGERNAHWDQRAHQAEGRADLDDKTDPVKAAAGLELCTLQQPFKSCVKMFTAAGDFQLELSAISLELAQILCAGVRDCRRGERRGATACRCKAPTRRRRRGNRALMKGRTEISPALQRTFNAPSSYKFLTVRLAQVPAVKSRPKPIIFARLGIYTPGLSE